MFEKIKSVYVGKFSSFIGSHHFLTIVLFILWISVPIVLLLQKLKSRIHPNVITLASFVVGLSASYFFFEDRLFFGAISYFLFLVLDDVDGMWARLTGKTSHLGRMLDYYVGHIGTVSMYFGIWYSQYYTRGEWSIGTFLIAARYVIALCLQVLVESSTYGTILPRVSSYYSSQEEKFGTFFVAPLLGIVRTLLPILISIQLISFLVLFLRQKQRPDPRQRLKERTIIR